MLPEYGSGGEETEREKEHPNDFLEKSCIPLSGSPKDLEGHSLVERAASLQKQLVTANPDNWETGPDDFLVSRAF